MRLQQNEDFLTHIWSLIILKVTIVQQLTFSLVRTNIQPINADDVIIDAQIFRSEIFCFAVYIKDDFNVNSWKPDLKNYIMLSYSWNIFPTSVTLL